LVEQTSSGKYRLNKTGENAVRLIGDLKAWAPALSVQGKNSPQNLASLKKRAYSFLIDFAIVASVFVAAALTSNVFSVISGGGFRLDVNVILFVLVFWLYSPLLGGLQGRVWERSCWGLWSYG
jgi:hypothetical protein